MQVWTGHERLLHSHRSLIRGRKLGLIVNPTSVDHNLVHLATRLTQDPEMQVDALFGPEHGIRGTEQDMIAVDGAVAPLVNAPVYSLYGSTVDSLRPPKDVLADLDVLIFDIQDVGSRYYTYIYTMMLAMEVAAETDTDVLVLDRPNPLGGQVVEGNLVHAGYDSFVGMHPLANRHGMTVGELARLFRKERNIDVQLHVIEMTGWSREQWFDDTGLPWILPSPNMPTPDTATVYPGMCLLEGTNLSEGRGTTRPFEIFGAPYLDTDAYAEALNDENLPGCLFRPHLFRPTFQKHAKTPCEGVQLHVTDRNTFRSMRAGIAAIVHARRLAPEGFDWRNEAYEFVEDIPAIDLLFGTSSMREAIEQGASAEEIEASMSDDLNQFKARREPCLIYPQSREA